MAYCIDYLLQEINQICFLIYLGVGVSGEVARVTQMEVVYRKCIFTVSPSFFLYFLLSIFLSILLYFLGETGCTLSHHLHIC